MFKKTVKSFLMNLGISKIRYCFANIVHHCFVSDDMLFFCFPAGLHRDYSVYRVSVDLRVLSGTGSCLSVRGEHHGGQCWLCSVSVTA